MGEAARLPVLALFGALEIACYNAPAAVKAVVAVLEYLFVLAVFCRSPRQGLQYFVAFTLLAYGAWTYVTTDETPPGFWGLRIGPISVNALVAGVLATLCVARSLDRPYRVLPSTTLRILGAYSLYALALGGLRVLFGTVHADDYARDLLVGVLLFVYSYMLAYCEVDALEQLLQRVCFVTLAMSVAALVGGLRFDYGDGFEFVLMNAVSFLLPVAPFVLLGSVWNTTRWVACALTLALLASGQVFLGGKALVMLAILLVWVALHTKRGRVLLFGVVTAVVLGGTGLVEAVLARVGDEVVVVYKLLQVLDVFAIADVHALSVMRTSMGNLVAEATTITTFVVQHPYFAVFGGGFGTGVPDLYGYLTPLAGRGAGYSFMMVERDSFVRMHLPLFEVVLRAGLVAASAFLFAIGREFRSRQGTGFAVSILLLMVVSHSKEMLLLSVLLAVIHARRGEQVLAPAAGHEAQGAGNSGED